MREVKGFKPVEFEELTIPFVVHVKISVAKSYNKYFTKTVQIYSKKEKKAFAKNWGRAVLKRQLAMKEPSSIKLTANPKTNISGTTVFDMKIKEN